MSKVEFKKSLEDTHGELLADWAEVTNEIADTLDLIESGLYTEASLCSKLENLLTKMKQ